MIVKCINNRYKGIEILNMIDKGEIVENTRFRLIDASVHVGLIYQNGTLSTYGDYGSNTTKIIVRDVSVSYLLSDRIFEMIEESGQL